MLIQVFFACEYFLFFRYARTERDYNNNVFNRAASSEKVPSNKRNMGRFRLTCACVKYDTGICSPFIHSLVCTGSVCEKIPSNMYKMCGFTSCYACAKYYPALCSPLKHFLVSNDSICGKRSSDQTMRISRLIWAFAVRICPKTRFCMVLSNYCLCMLKYNCC